MYVRTERLIEPLALNRLFTVYILRWKISYQQSSIQYFYWSDYLFFEVSIFVVSFINFSLVKNHFLVKYSKKLVHQSLFKVTCKLAYSEKIALINSFSIILQVFLWIGKLLQETSIVILDFNESSPQESDANSGKRKLFLYA